MYSLEEEYKEKRREWRKGFLTGWILAVVIGWIAYLFFRYIIIK